MKNNQKQLKHNKKVARNNINKNMKKRGGEI